MISSRSLDDLVPRVKSKCLDFISACKLAQIDILITSTYRDFESQDALYARGRTLSGNKVTNAKAGQSFHNFKVAFDFVPVVNGKPQWNDIDTFTRCGEIAEAMGLEWAGRWKTFKELAHCQDTGGLTLADFQSGKTLK